MRHLQPVGLVALACAVLVAPTRAGATAPASASARPYTEPTPETTPVPAVPVPPPYVPDLGPLPPTFRFDEDSGRQLVLDQRAAQIAVFAARMALEERLAALPPLERERRRLALRADLSRAELRLAQRAIHRNQRRSELASIDEYVGARPTDELVDSVESVLSADSLMDLERAHVLRDAQRDGRAAERQQLGRDMGRAAAAVDDSDRDLEALDERLLDARHAVVAARVALDASVSKVAELDAFEEEWLAAAARTAASPIMGPSALDVDDLVRKVRAADVTVRTTVPLEELAALFLEEGAAEGVRGDVAFAQSILETGSFSNPASGSKVIFTDNNFAGIGACDSCEHGRVFETARDGVRAQIQALRTYADPTVDSVDDYAHAMVLPKQLEWIRAGKTKVWYELTGKWATGAGYGLHIFDVYRDMYAMRTETELAAPTMATDTSALAATVVAKSRVTTLLVEVHR
jgi:hypothetical protein